MKKEIILNYLSKELRHLFKNIDDSFFEKIIEIRLRINKPIIIYRENKEFFLDKNGIVKNNIEEAYFIKEHEIKETLELMSNFSLYAIENELKNGYITLPGGHRVGISGKIVLEKNNIKTINNVSSLNIRIAHEIFDCSSKILDYIIKPNIMHTMIISPPGCGKTTLLRDIIKQISNGIKGKLVGQTVGVVDERSEIGGCYKGIAQNNLGIRTDILDNCPKAEGMMILLRTMAPKIIAVDEIGNKEDIYAIDGVINAGIKIICTVHGNSLIDIKEKPILSDLINKNIFERYIILSNEKKTGTVKNIYNKNFVEVYKNVN